MVMRAADSLMRSLVQYKFAKFGELMKGYRYQSRVSKVFRSNWTQIDLSHLVILDILQPFEHRLSDIDILTGAINPECHMKTTNLWDFLRSYIGDKNGHYYFLEAMGNYYYKEFGNVTIKKNVYYKCVVRKLSLSTKYYNWENNVTNETISKMCGALQEQ
ncbi:3967_t:CDS:2 [Gigaspora margarita]|uniref:3967_t:CDS:1 n=1 Tax=Gigaspora margarita TaxID=4874 RepID=A0ABN7VSU9_GIGMA|nr:3967_t:CDS:2 [Gigaspora margarita]